MQMARSTYYFELSKADQVAVRNHCLADEIKDIFSQHKAATVCEEYIRN